MIKFNIHFPVYFFNLNGESFMKSTTLQFFGIIATLIFGYYKLKKQFRLNKDWEDSKNFIPILLRLSQNLLNLHYVFLFRGKFCPPIEAKCPTLEKPNEKAERGYQFLQIGIEIINDLKQIVYLIPSKKLPNLINLCSNILDHLEKKEKGKKRHLDYLIVSIIGALDKETKQEFDKESELFYDFYFQLHKIMKEEFISLNS